MLVNTKDNWRTKSFSLIPYSTLPLFLTIFNCSVIWTILFDWGILCISRLAFVYTVAFSYLFFISRNTFDRPISQKNLLSSLLLLNSDNFSSIFRTSGLLLRALLLSNFCMMSWHWRTDRWSRVFVTYPIILDTLIVIFSFKSAVLSLLWRPVTCEKTFLE